MAQWQWQFLGHTHGTKVQDLEEALRCAVGSARMAEENEIPKRLRAIKQLAVRLLSARIKLLKSRGSTKVEDVREAGIEAILEEFGLESIFEGRAGGEGQAK